MPIVLVREPKDTKWHVPKIGKRASPHNPNNGYYMAVIETYFDWPVHPSLLCYCVKEATREEARGSRWVPLEQYRFMLEEK